MLIFLPLRPTPETFFEEQGQEIFLALLRKNLREIRDIGYLLHCLLIKN